MTLDTFTRSYIEAALWSSTAYGHPDDNGNGNFDTSFQSANYDIDDLSPALLAHVIEDCANFQRQNAILLSIADYRRAEYSDSELAGHDFWLTRNRHGAGFWDRGLGAVGQALTDAAHAYGEETWAVTRDTSDPDDFGVIDLM